MNECLFTEDIFWSTLVSFPALVNNPNIKFISYDSSYVSSNVIAEPVALNSNLIKSSVMRNEPQINKGLSAGKSFPNLVRFFQSDIIHTWPNQYEGISEVSHSPSARIYNITYYKQANPIFIFAVTGNNYCVNIRRRHKRNNIFFVINVIDFSFVQGCYDNSCNHFRSEKMLLPAEVFFSTGRKRKVS